MKRILLLTFLSSLWQPLYAIDPGVFFDTDPKPCNTSPFINFVNGSLSSSVNSLTIYGDSRAAILGDKEQVGLVDPDLSARIRPIEDAAVNGIPIIFPGAADGAQNLGWPGSPSTQSPASDLVEHILFDGWRLGPMDHFWTMCHDDPSPDRAICWTFMDVFKMDHSLFGGPNNWQRNLATCARKGDPYQNAPTAIVNLGGIDILRFYSIMSDWEGEYLWLRWILNPRQSLESLFNHRSLDSEMEFFWLWSYHVNNARVADSVASSVDYFMTAHRFPNGSHHDAAYRTLIMSEAPVIPTLWAIVMGGGHGMAGIEGFLRLIQYFGDYDIQLQKRIPGLEARYGANNIAFLDMYWPYVKNMLFSGSSYIWGLGDPCGGDGVHFTCAGVLQQGRMVAAKMTDKAWFPRSQALIGTDFTPLYNADPIPGLLITLPDNPPGCDVVCLYCIFFHCSFGK